MKWKVKEKRYSAGSFVFAEGDPAFDAYIVKKGSIKIIRKSKGKRFDLAILKEGELFGDASAIIGKSKQPTRNADAFVLEDSVLMEINHDHLLSLIGECPPFIRTWLRLMSVRLSDTNDILLKNLL